MFWEFSKSQVFCVTCFLLFLQPLLVFSQFSEQDKCPGSILAGPSTGMSLPHPCWLNKPSLPVTSTWLSWEGHPLISNMETDFTILTGHPTQRYFFELPLASSVQGNQLPVFYLSTSHHGHLGTLYLHPDSQDALPATKRSFCKPHHTCILLFSTIVCIYFGLKRFHRIRKLHSDRDAASLFSTHSPLHYICALSPVCVIFMMSSSTMVTSSWTGSLTKHGS